LYDIVCLSATLAGFVIWIIIEELRALAEVADAHPNELQKKPSLSGMQKMQPSAQHSIC
jgi:hypothetical protein